VAFERLGHQRHQLVIVEPELVHDELAAFDLRVDPPDQAIAMQQRTDVPTPLPLRRGLVDLPHVIEVERVAHEVAVPQQRIERAEDAHAVVVRRACFEKRRHREVAPR
jgi:hypothetical protein